MKTCVLNLENSGKMKKNVVKKIFTILETFMNKKIALEHLKCNVYLLSKCLGTIICIFWKEVVNSLGST